MISLVTTIQLQQMETFIKLLSALTDMVDIQSIATEMMQLNLMKHLPTNLHLEPATLPWKVGFGLTMIYWSKRRAYTYRQ